MPQGTSGQQHANADNANSGVQTLEFVLERRKTLIKLANRLVSKNVVDLGMSGNRFRSLGSRLMEVLQNHFERRLGRCWRSSSRMKLPPNECKSKLR